jgi:hypothetical protein
MMIVIASVAVAIIAFILYALERKSKNEPIIWESAGKLSIFGGLLTAGIVFALTVSGGGDVANTAVEVATAGADAGTVVQEMFSGIPTF